MGNLLISKKSVRKNKDLKMIQKGYLKTHKKIKTRYPKAKLGKVLENFSERFIDCTTYTEKPTSFDINKYSPEEILKMIESKDIRGLSGSAFPEIKKIKGILSSNSKEKYLIVNGVSCDPGLLHDSFIKNNFMNEINKGIEILDKCINFKNAIIASDENIPAKYPMGAEKILVKFLLDIDISENEFPVDKGILVMNIQTIYSIYQAFYTEDMGIKTRYITVGNLNNGMAEIAKVEIGQTINEILLKTNIGYTDSEDIYFGMGVMESEKTSLNAKISLDKNFIGFGSVATFDDNAKCKKCGSCSRKCPMGVKIHKIIQSVQNSTCEDLTKYNIDKCIMCGTCSYYCRASKNTMRIIQSVR